MKERLFKKKCIKQNNRRTYVVNMLFSVTVVTLTMHVAFQKKIINVISLRVTFPFKHVVGGREAHKMVGVELLVFPSLLRFPPYFVSHPLFFPNFVRGGIPMFGGRLNVWVKYIGGMSTCQNING